MNRDSSGISWAVPAAVALGLCACSVAPVMDPTHALGVSHLAAVDPNAAPEKAAAQYERFFKGQQDFDRPFENYAQELNSTLESLQKGGSAWTVPVDGIPYYYLRHVTNLARAYIGSARVHYAKQDYGRAERGALNAIEIIQKRGLFNPVCVNEIEEEAWGLLVKIYTDWGYPGSAEMAQTQQKLKFDYMMSPQGLEAYVKFASLKLEGERNLGDANQMISRLNAQKRSETLSAFAAGAAAMGSAMASYQEATLRAQASRQGYMTSDQAAGIQMAQMNRMTSNMLLNQTLSNAGRWGNSIAMLHSFASPTLFRQFTDKSAGVRPSQIIQEFSQRATKLGRGDLAITKKASELSGAMTSLDKLRESGGTPQAKQAAYQKFVPAFASLSAELRKVRKETP
ncbi:MAG: hypothetical protein HY078_03410 [Elusimicrobia bacterium]|nr:hypothetical protein [Elusimicrobiota bacterium]